MTEKFKIGNEEVDEFRQTYVNDSQSGELPVRVGEDLYTLKCGDVLRVVSYADGRPSTITLEAGHTVEIG